MVVTPAGVCCSGCQSCPPGLLVFAVLVLLLSLLPCLVDTPCSAVILLMPGPINTPRWLCCHCCLSGEHPHHARTAVHAALPHERIVALPLLLPCPMNTPHHAQATGIQAKWERVKGLPEALGDGHVVSNMNWRTAPLTFKAVQGLKKGKAVFTMPKGVIKCPGAGQKVSRRVASVGWGEFAKVGCEPLEWHSPCCRAQAQQVWTYLPALHQDT